MLKQRCFSRSRMFCIVLLLVQPLILPINSILCAETQKLSFKERLKAKAAEAANKAKLRLKVINNKIFKTMSSEKYLRIRNALILGVTYGKQAKKDEANGYKFAHQKAAYDWGYEVGDPALITMIRFYWEGVQLGVFAFGDHQERSGKKSPRVEALESLVGGNGKEYTVNRAYINDIFDDVQIATDGAQAKQNGEVNDFDRYSDKHLK